MRGIPTYLVNRMSRKFPIPQHGLVCPQTEDRYEQTRTSLRVSLSVSGSLRPKKELDDDRVITYQFLEWCLSDRSQILKPRRVSEVQLAGIL